MIVVRSDGRPVAKISSLARDTSTGGTDWGDTVKKMTLRQWMSKPLGARCEATAQKAYSTACVSLMQRPGRWALQPGTGWRQNRHNTLEDAVECIQGLGVHYPEYAYPWTPRRRPPP